MEEAKDKSGPVGIGEGLHNGDGTVVALIFKFVGHMEYNEEQALAILEKLWIFVHHFPTLNWWRVTPYMLSLGVFSHLLSSRDWRGASQ